MGNYTDTLLANAGPTSEPLLEAQIGTAMESEAEAAADDAATLAAAQGSAAALYIPLAQKGAASGVATLDSQAIIPTAQVAAVRPNGVETPSDWEFLYTPGTRIVSSVSGAFVNPTYVWVDGVRLEIPGAARSHPAHAAVTGAYYLVLDSAGTFSMVAAASLNLETMAPLVSVYYNATSGTGFWLDERHPNTMSWADHRADHLYRGAYRQSGGTIADYVLDTFGDANVAFSIAQTTIYDENILHVLSALAAGGPYTIGYRTGADTDNDLSFGLANTVPYLHDGDKPYKNAVAAGTWGQSLVTVNYFFSYWLLACPAYNDGGDNYKYRYILFQAQNEYATLEEALSESFYNLDLGGLEIPEMVALQRITYQRKVSGGSKDCKIIAVTSLLGTQLSILGRASPMAHGALSGLHYNLAGHTGFQRGMAILAAAPGVNHDEVNTAAAVDITGTRISGFAAGQLAMNTASVPAGRLYICTDASEGAANWEDISDQQGAGNCAVSYLTTTGDAVVNPINVYVPIGGTWGDSYADGWTRSGSQWTCVRPGRYEWIFFGTCKAVAGGPLDGYVAIRKNTDAPTDRNRNFYNFGGTNGAAFTEFSDSFAAGDVVAPQVVSGGLCTIRFQPGTKLRCRRI